MVKTAVSPIRTKKGRSIHASLGLHGTLSVAALISILPAILILLNSFKSDEQIKSSKGLNLLPKTWTLDGYYQVLTDNDSEFLTWFRNSIFVASLTMVIGVFLSATAAYVLSRFIFPGRKSVLNFFLLTQMFPAAILLVPIYQILVRFPLFHFSMLDSVPGLLLAYSTIAVPFCTWMLKGFFDGIPRELDEAGALDGLSPFGIFRRIIFPLALPGIAVTCFFTFLTAWNEVAFANVVAISPEHYTLPVGLRTYIFQFDQAWQKLSVSAVLVTVPSLVVFLFAQRYLVSGLTRGAVKG